MDNRAWLLVLLLPTALLVVVQVARAVGRARAVPVALAALLLGAAAWLHLGPPYHASAPVAAAGPAEAAPSPTCLKCHESHYTSWHRTYHRTMTREATPENVKGDFDNASYTYQGVTTRLTRAGDDFYMETLDPAWAEQAARSGRRPEDLGPARRRTFKVDRLVGSHWFQECMYRDDAGRYWRLPVSYHIVERRWVHTNGAFLAPDTDEFWAKSTVWNESCVYCHNTKPSKNPGPKLPGRGVPSGYRTTVAELGIACEACHGPGAAHVRANRDPLRRFALHGTAAGDPTIVNPRRLSVARADAVCAHCHGALAPRPEAWGPAMTDPFNAGEELTRTYFPFWSEAEQKLRYEGQASPPSLRPEPDDGRFWGDGTPLTTAVEYQGMALSACYQGGRGRLSCLSCHALHPQEPNFMLGPRRETNEACLQCHEGFRGRLAEHTHHAADSAGSLCYNCHMPYQVYSLLTTHRSHRIVSPRVRDSVGTGKPHACNLCHLDRSLAWTQEVLGKWYGTPPEPLPEEDRRLASSLVALCRDDARTRVVVAGAFSWPPALEASGTDWAGPVLAQVLGRERYPAVRYLAHRGLRALDAGAAAGYDYLAVPAERERQLGDLRARFEARGRPDPAAHPHVPLGPDGRLDESALEQLLRRRNDPDVFVHE